MYCSMQLSDYYPGSTRSGTRGLGGFTRSLLQNIASCGPRFVTARVARHRFVRPPLCPGPAKRSLRVRPGDREFVGGVEVRYSGRAALAPPTHPPTRPSLL